MQMCEAACGPTRRGEPTNGVPGVLLCGCKSGTHYVMARTALTTTASAERPFVSKSKFLWGAQCKKLLWYAYNDRNRPGGIIVAYAVTGAPPKNSRLTRYEHEDAVGNADAT